MPQRNGRVQVRDLEAPEDIRPAPVQSDTFAAPAQPVIDNSMEQLAKGLGTFNENLMAYHRATAGKGDKEEKLRRLGEYSQFLAGIPNPDDRIGAIEQSHFFNDPYVRAVARVDHGQYMALRVGAQADREAQAGRIPFGTPDFNSRAYLFDLARGPAESLRGNPEGSRAFQQALDRTAENFDERHRKAAVEAAIVQSESIATRQLEMALINANSSPDIADYDVQGTLRAVYQDLGPRVRGGSLDLKYNRLDELLLNVLESDKYAKDPRYAGTVLQLLRQDRTDLVTGGRLSSIASVAANRDKVEAIERKVRDGQATAWHQSADAQLLAEDRELVRQNSPGLHMLMDVDVPNPFDSTKRLKLSANERRERAIEAFVIENRQRHLNTPYSSLDPEMPTQQQAIDRALEVETQTIINSGYKHPQFLNYLEGEFQGAINSSSNSPDALPRLVAAAKKFNDIANQNPSYMSTHLPERARTFYEGFTSLVQAGWTEARAGEAMRRAYSQPTAERQEYFSRQLHIDIENAVKGLDFRTVGTEGWRSLLGGALGGGANNQHGLRARVQSLATTLVKAEAADTPEAAVELAARYIQEKAVFVNGRAIYGVPGFLREDVQHVQPLLQRVFDANKAVLQIHGINRAADLSIAPFREGVFNVVAADPARYPMPLTAPDGQIIRLSLAHIREIRNTTNKTEHRAVIDRLMGAFRSPDEPIVNPSPTAP